MAMIAFVRRGEALAEIVHKLASLCHLEVPFAKTQASARGCREFPTASITHGAFLEITEVLTIG